MAKTQDFKYQVDDNLICNIRLNEAAGIKDAYGAEPAAAVTHPFHVPVNRNAQKFGIRPRTCIFEATTTSGSPVKTFSRFIEVPILTKSHYDSIQTKDVAANAQGQGGQTRTQFTYDGLTYKAKTRKAQEYV